MKPSNQHTGLTDAEVIKSREEHGANILVAPESDPVWKALLLKFAGPLGHKFKHKKGRNKGKPYSDADPLIFVLEIAAVLSILVSCSQYYGWMGIERQPAAVFFEPVGIIVAILLAVGLAFYFEYQADSAFSALNEKSDEERVKVVRNGSVTEIERQEVVVGDIVVLSTGDEIPADGELLEAVMMQVDESSLTGEPVCRKSTDAADFDKDATYPTNHVLRSTKVMEGHGVYRVGRVGQQTEYGKVFEAAQIDDTVKTPLNEQLDSLGNWITLVSYALAVVIVIGHVAWWFIQGNAADMAFVAYFLQKLMIAVTLIVVAVPEGLPMAVTLSLAYSMRAMLRTNNLVRKMHACETMGATTVICTDKTGTLTQNKMQVAETTFADLTPELAQGIAVNTTASLDYSSSVPKPIGNPTEGALLLWLNEKGYDYRRIKAEAKVIAEVPFSTEKKYMSTTIAITAADGSAVEEQFTKGAPEIVYSLCSSSDIDENTLHTTLCNYQNKAYRTLGFARNDHFLGIVAISDPVREDVPAAVSECLKAGIDVKIVTGDTPGTAREIARQIGILPSSHSVPSLPSLPSEPSLIYSRIITGADLDAMTDEELQSRVMDLKIIARARPMDKKRLVEALQARNQVVSVTGDGTNDAPALKQAHVGLSMGDGTAVAKEASDITIIDNSFSSIGKAVMWGR
ncbi:MAG: HAD-IC family P-type ATPase, partial [Bacteroidaceae bacterium]|nr:HAD-IC family P-type ATPase [Bacteroidaceae bacterium]